MCGVRYVEDGRKGQVASYFITGVTFYLERRSAIHETNFLHIKQEYQYTQYI